MRGYIDPNKRLMNAQTRDNHFQFAGQTGTWRAWVSATTGFPMLGQGGVTYFRQQTITGLFANNPSFPSLTKANTENQYAGGQFAGGDLMLTTRERLGYRDEVIYNGNRYKVDTDSVPSVMNGFFTSVLRRAATGT